MRNELEARSLDSTGAKDDLSNRLKDALDKEKVRIRFNICLVFCPVAII